jgi:HD superfamily phosphohydrolase YqeK
MALLEKIVFMADKLDPRKEGRDPFQESLRILAYEDLDAAVVQFLEAQIRHLLDRQGLLHPAALDARNFLLLHKGGNA